jgi:hypothetical protein
MTSTFIREQEMSARKNFTIRLDAREEAHIKAQAVRAGMVTSQFVRHALLGMSVPVNGLAQEQKIVDRVDLMDRVVIGRVRVDADDGLSELRLSDEA